jgi:hypothetical protein
MTGMGPGFSYGFRPGRGPHDALDLPLHRQRRHPELAGLHVPLPTLRRHLHGCLRTAGALLSGRGADYPTPPPQIPACGFPAPGSRQRSDAIVGLDATNPQARGFCDMPSPALSPEHALPLTYPFDRPPSLRHLRRRLRSALFDASTVLCSRPTPRLFLDSFVSSTSCRGPGSLKRLRARRGLPGSDAVLPYVMWPQTPAGRRFLA